MKTYTIARKPAQLDWDTIPALAIDTALWGTQTDIIAKAQLCYDDAALYVRLSAIESEIRAEENGPLGSPCRDSCLEFFFAPLPADKRYFNVEFNPVGCLYLGYGSDRYNLVRLLPEKAPIIPQIQRTEDGWNICYSIPFAFIRQFFPEFAPVSGGSIQANFYKCGDDTSNPHYLCWNPITQAQPDYHLRQYFGNLIFA